MFSARPAAHSLDDLLPQFSESSNHASALLAKLTLDQIARRPQPNTWSVAECLTHLIISAEAFFEVWRRELAEAREKGRTGGPPYHQDFWGWLLTWSLEPPPRFKMKAPKNIQPVAVGPAETILPQFLDRQTRIAEAIESARGLAVDQIEIASPVDARVRYSVWSSFCLNAAHQRRHLWQAARVAQSLGTSPNRPAQPN